MIGLDAVDAFKLELRPLFSVPAASAVAKLCFPGNHKLAKAANLCLLPHARPASDYLVGPPGFEPGTKGFTLSDCFQSARTISSPSALCSAGGVRDALACHQGRSMLRISPQVVSAPSSAVTLAWLRIAAGTGCPIAAVSLNSSRSRSRITPRRHHFDESPALTVVL